MPTFIRLPSPEFLPHLSHGRGSSSISTPSISERPSSRSSLNSLTSLLPHLSLAALPDNQSYFAPSVAPPIHTCEDWQSRTADDSTEALLPANDASQSRGSEAPSGSRPRSGTVTSKNSTLVRDCAACRSGAAAKRAVMREDIVDAWLQKLPSRESEWDATSTASGITVSSAGTGCFSIEDAADTSQWFIPHRGPNVEWLGTGPSPSEWEMIQDSEGEYADGMEVEGNAAALGAAHGGSDGADAASGRGAHSDYAKKTKRPLSRRFLKTMLPCFPVP